MTIPLGKIISLRAGYPFRSGIPLDRDGAIAVIQGRDVDSERSRIAPAEGEFARIAADTVRNLSDHLLEPDDVILMARGPRNYAVTVGKEVPAQAIVTGSFHVLHSGEQQLMPAFLAWLLNQESSQTFMRSNNSGTTIPMISLDALRALPVLLPPLDMQRRIVELNTMIEHEHDLMNHLTTARRELLRGWANQQAAHA